jgi:hypothetical protein
MKRLITPLLLALSLFLSGCIDMDQELVINSDGSGKMTVTLGMAETLMAMVKAQSGKDGEAVCTMDADDDAFIQANDYVSGVSYSERQEAGMYYCTKSIAVSDFRKFREARDAIVTGDNDKFEFPFTIEDLPDGNIRLTQDFSNIGRDDPNQTETEKEASEMAMKMMRSMMAGRYFSITVKAPKIVSSNGQISEDGTTVTWKKALIDIFEHPEEEHKFEVVLAQEMGWMDQIKAWWESL